MEAERQQSGTSSVGEESEVADAHETGRQHMEQKSAQELIDFKSHGPFPFDSADSGSQIGTEQAGVGGLVGKPPHGAEPQVDGSRSEQACFEIVR